LDVHILNNKLKSFLKINDSSHSIALGIALGLFIGMTPTVGFQMLIAGIVATLFNANRIAAIAMVYITNPFSIIPIYSFNYYIGKIVLGLNKTPYYKIFIKDFAQAQGVIEKAEILLKQGWKIQAPLWIGSIIMGILVSLPAYILVKKIIVHHREKHNLKDFQINDAHVKDFSI
jgi:uncharacterized protein (DUF2062 family)